MLLIPIPMEWAGLLLMGFGVFFWLLAMIDFLGWANTRLKKRELDTVWDSNKKAFVPDALTRRISSYFIMFGVGLGFFLFGYLVFTGLIWDLI